MGACRRGAIAAIAVLALAPATAHAGYTHYFTWVSPPPPEALANALAQMRSLAEKHPQLVEVSPEDPAHPGITINGKGDLAHEPFVFPGTIGFNAVKTAGKPYDAVVTACLLVARTQFSRSNLIINSDGTWEDGDWVAGATMYKELTGWPAMNPLDHRIPSQPKSAFSLPFLGVGSLGVGGILAIALVVWYLFGRDRGSVGGGWSSYYLFYLLVPAAIALFSAHPAFLGLAVIAFLGRRWLPDPWVLLRQAGRVRSLRNAIADNRANVTARRDLARVYLERRRPAKALPLLKEALAIDSSSIELRFLSGLARLDSGDPAHAVEDLIAVVHADPSFGRGDPYLRAADALIKLERWDDAQDALERFLGENSSSVEGRYKLARVYAKKGDEKGARTAAREARTLYSSLPRFQRRRQIGWYVRALFV